MKKVKRSSKVLDRPTNDKPPVVEYIFLLLPLYVAITGTVAIFWLLLGLYGLITIIPTSIGLSVVATWLILKSNTKEASGVTGREIKLFGALTIAGVLVWVGVNALYTAQNIFIYRDPAIYTVTGRMLVDSDNLQVDIPKYLREMPHVEHESAGFGPDVYDKGSLFAQGLHFLPALLGLSGRIAGEALMLKAAPVIGGLALLALYGFIRRFTKPRWAALGTLVFGLSLPMIYFSRDTYTEPLSVMLIFNALALFTLALKSRGVGLWVISGILFGAVSLVRADGLIVLASAIACLIVFLALASKQERGPLTKNILIFLGFAVPLVGLSILDMRILSSGYYLIHGKEVKQLLLIITVLIVTGLLFITINWKTNIFKKIQTLLGRRILPIILCLIGIAVLILASRPLWLISRDDNQPSVITSYIAGLQALNGDIVDPTRNYAEQTGNWLVWYMGYALVFAAVIGVFIATKRLLENKDNTLLLPLVLIGGASTIFMVKVGITPDQIWAARRFLPITFPGIVFLGVLALEKCANISSKFRNIKVGMLIVAPLIILICFEAASITYPLARVRVYGGQLRQIRSVCQELEGERLAVWLGPDAWSGIQTIKSYCGVDAVAFREVNNKKISDIKEYSRRHSVSVAYIATGYDYAKVLSGIDKSIKFSEVSRVDYMIVPSELHHPPIKGVLNSRSILIAK